MKKLVLSSILLICSWFLFAEEKDSVLQTNLSNKIPVYVKQIPGSQITSVYFVVKGGTSYLTPETSGLEDALFSMMILGSEKYSYSDLQNFGFNTQSSCFSSANCRKSRCVESVPLQSRT